MNNFSYARATDTANAIGEIARDNRAKFIAGGTNLIDLMKENVAHPSRLVDINRLPLNTIVCSDKFFNFIIFQLLFVFIFFSSTD